MLYLVTSGLLYTDTVPLNSGANDLMVYGKRSSHINADVMLSITHLLP